MVGRDDDDGVAALGRIGLHHGHRAVEFNRVEHPSLGVHGVGLLVDGRSFNHQHKAFFFAAQHLQRHGGHLIQHGLVREAVVVNDG